jgi:glycolate dehydrogenase iron-sulfur subunit
MVARPAFDDHHPPDPALIKDCVHCGFCLPACPTYRLWGEEMDSPRGRIHLMKQASEGAPVTEAFARHLDLCLGCMGCLTACPSGVRYDRLLEATRQQIDRRYRRSLLDRLFRALLFRLFPYPGRMRLLRAGLGVCERLGLRRILRGAGVVRVLPARLQALESLAAPADLGPAERVPERTEPAGPPRCHVAVLTGCVQSVFFSSVNAATVRVLAAEGCRVLVPAKQGCCGALSLHAGREAEAQAFARRTIATFEAEDVDAVVVNAAGCGSALKEYGHLLRDDPEWGERARRFSARVRDLSELLVDVGPAAPRQPLPVVAAYHDACHLGHAQRIRTQPRALLRGIPGLELREVPEADLCCGSAGIYNILEPEPARALGARKAEGVLATGAQLLVTSNPGCAMQIRAALDAAGRSLAIVHLAEVLDASIRGRPVAPAQAAASTCSVPGVDERAARSQPTNAPNRRFDTPTSTRWTRRTGVGR